MNFAKEQLNAEYETGYLDGYEQCKKDIKIRIKQLTQKQTIEEIKEWVNKLK